MCACSQIDGFGESCLQLITPTNCVSVSPPLHYISLMQQETLNHVENFVLEIIARC